MGGRLRDRSSRAGRKSCHAAKTLPDPSAESKSSDLAIAVTGGNDGGERSGDGVSSSLAHRYDDRDSKSVNPSPVDESMRVCRSEDRLEALMLKRLDIVYKEVAMRLVALGYDGEDALRAILCSDHRYGFTGVLSNVLYNALDVPRMASKSVVRGGFAELRHHQEYCIAGMVCILQKVRPNLSRGDAMRCLLMNDMHVGRAAMVKNPALQPHAASCSAAPVPSPVPTVQVSTGGGAADDGAPVRLCKFHLVAAAAEAVGSIDTTDPWFLSLPPSIKSVLRRKAFMVPSAQFCSKVKSLESMGNSVLSLEQQDFKQENVASVSSEVGNGSPNNDILDSVLRDLEGMNLGDDGPEDPKKEMILEVIRQIKELDIMLKERKEWAQQKALQAARKLCNDMTELRMLRMEKEENQQLIKCKQELGNTTMKRLSEMESALKKISGQVDQVNAAVRQLETENCEIQAEMEASKLSASESAKACAEVTRRENKCLKKIAAQEKHKEKMQEEIAQEKKKIMEMQQRLDRLQSATKEN